MNDDGLRKRGRGLEEGHFAKLDRERIERIRSEWQHEEERRSLVRESGLGEDSVDFLLDVGILAETLPALDWIRLVEVAWSDGDLDIQEMERLLTAAEEDCVNLGHPAHHLLLTWTETRSSPALFDAWKQHVALKGRTHAQRKQILNRVDKVARASGGLLGLKAISDAKTEVLERVKEILG